MSQVLEKARSMGFWAFDVLKGQKVKKHYADIKSILENESSRGSISRRKKYLSDILQHAINTSPYYQKMGRESKLEDFPVVNKNIIRDNIDCFISSKFTKEDLISGMTSGSTGTPFKFYKDKNKKLRNDADFLYFYQKGGYSTGHRLYYLRVWNNLNKKSVLSAWSKNLVMQDTSSLSDSNTDKFLNKLIADKADKFVLTYASSIEAICSNASIKDASRFNVKAIFSSSEVLTDAARKKVACFFDCPVYSRYSNQENGLIAQQYSMSDYEFQINTASYVIEVLEFDSDKPAQLGERGRIVVTDLFNFGMPMIRYDTGDIGILSDSSVIDGPAIVLKTIEGRKTDCIYDTSGDLVSPHILTNTLLRYEKQIKQYQFIQNDAREYCIKLNCKNEEFNLEDNLILNLRQYLGGDANIAIEYVNEIPLLNSGKRRKIINNYRKPL